MELENLQIRSKQLRMIALCLTNAAGCLMHGHTMKSYAVQSHSSCNAQVQRPPQLLSALAAAKQVATLPVMTLVGISHRRPAHASQVVRF